MQHNRVIQHLPNRLSCSLGRACCYWERPAKAAQCILHIPYMLALALLLLHTVRREWRSQAQPFPKSESRSQLISSLAHRLYQRLLLLTKHDVRQTLVKRDSNRRQCAILYFCTYFCISGGKLAKKPEMLLSIQFTCMRAAVTADHSCLWVLSLLLARSAKHAAAFHSSCSTCRCSTPHPAARPAQ